MRELFVDLLEVPIQDGLTYRVLLDVRRIRTRLVVENCHDVPFNRSSEYSRYKSAHTLYTDAAGGTGRDGLFLQVLVAGALEGAFLLDLDALEKLGCDPFNMRAVGKGSHEPVADNSTDEGRAKNRRVEFIKK
jgi:hypothetical protein